MSTWQPSIEGLDLPDVGATPGGPSGIAAAAVATVRALDEAELLRPQDALTVQLVLELASAIGRGLSYGKVSVATAQLTRQLIDAVEKLPQGAAAGDPLAEAFQKVVDLVTGEAESVAQGAA